MKTIPLFSNTLNKDELLAIKRIFRSKWLGYGEETKKFEEEFAANINSKFALGINSATAGLFLAMDILGIRENNEVILPTTMFIGAANAIVKNRAKSVFADVDPSTLNIKAEEVSRLINKKTRALILLHYGGHPCDFDSIEKALGKRKQDIAIIEDSANSIKSTYKDKYTGTLGTLGVFSFDAMKTLVTGDGGMLTFQEKRFFENVVKWRYLGILPGGESGFESASKTKANWWKIKADVPGNRYIMNDLTATVGRIQLKKLDKFIKIRKRIWGIYKKELSGIPQLQLPPEPLPHSTSSYYLFWVQTDTEKRRSSLAKTLYKNGIYSTFKYYPLHLIPFYGHKGKLSNAEKLNKVTLNIPLHQNLSDGDVEKVIKTIKVWAKKA